MIRPPLLMLIAWLGLIGLGQAQTQTATPSTVPTLTGRVVDEAGVLPQADRTALTAQLADLEAKTSVQLVVVTLKSLQGTTIEEYGYQLGRRWQIGQTGQNSGALLIVVPLERRVRIEVGYGLEGTLTDAATKVIIETAILPSFKAGDLPGGIKRGVDGIVQLLRADAGSTPSAPARTMSSARGGPDALNGMSGWPVIVVGLLVVALLIFCAVSGGGVCSGIMQVLFLVALSGGRGGSSGGGSSSFSGGGGSFGGGGSSGRW